MAAPHFADAGEEQRFSAASAKLLKATGLAAELRHRLVTTDVITELYAPETDFAVMLL